MGTQSTLTSSMLRVTILLALAAGLCLADQAPRQTVLSELDQGLLWKFANIELTSGEVFSGEIVGVFDESVFMWTPTEYTTIAVFTCNDASIPFSQFSTKPWDKYHPWEDDRG